MDESQLENLANQIQEAEDEEIEELSEIEIDAALIAEFEQLTERVNRLKISYEILHATRRNYA